MRKTLSVFTFSSRSYFDTKTSIPMDRKHWYYTGIRKSNLNMLKLLMNFWSTKMRGLDWLIPKKNNAGYFTLCGPSMCLVSASDVLLRKGKHLCLPPYTIIYESRIMSKIFLLSPKLGIAFSKHHGYKFSEPDHGPVKDNCATPYDSGWWFNEGADFESSCMYSNLNGRYYDTAEDISRATWDGIVFFTWKGSSYSLKESEMKIRPI